MYNHTTTTQMKEWGTFTEKKIYGKDGKGQWVSDKGNTKTLKEWHINNRATYIRKIILDQVREM